jgi:NAD(P)H dehydrogenase (quinone)
MLRPLHRGILEFTGFTVLEPQVVFGPVRIGEELRKQELARWQSRLKDVFNEPAFAVGAY